MKYYKSLLLFASVFSLLFLNACGGEDPFQVDYSAAPEPFPIVDSTKVETESGLTYYVVEEGSGDTVTRRSTVFVFYTGRTLDGNIFDSSYRNGAITPATFNDLGGLIQGFREGLIGMKEGEKRVLIIPPDLAYGSSETHTLRNDTLRFDIELDEIAY